MLKPLQNSSTKQSSRIFCHELFSVLRNPLFKPKSRITNSCKSSWFRYDSSMSRTITTEHCPQLRPHKGYASFYVHRSQPQSDHLVGVSAVRHQSSPQLETNRQVLVFSRVPLPFKAESWSKPSGLSRCVCVFDCAVRGQVRQPNGSHRIEKIALSHFILVAQQILVGSGSISLFHVLFYFVLGHLPVIIPLFSWRFSTKFFTVLFPLFS